MPTDFVFMTWLTSAALASVVAAFIAAITAFYTSRVTLRNSERKIQIDTVTQERAKWREKVRTLAAEVHKAAVAEKLAELDQLRLSFALNLNPFDEKDNLILKSISKLKETAAREQNLGEFSDRVAMLLKHDWDRAKNEAAPVKGFKNPRKTWRDLKVFRDGAAPCSCEKAD